MVKRANPTCPAHTPAAASIRHITVTRRKCGTFVEAYFSTKAKVVFIPANRFIAMAKFPLIDLTKD